MHCKKKIGKGHIIPLQKYKLTKQKIYIDELDEYEEELCMSDYEVKHYLLNVEEKQELLNGYRFIKELIVQGNNHRMTDAIRKLESNDMHVVAIKTDELTFVQKDIFFRASDVLAFGTNIGDCRR